MCCKVLRCTSDVKINAKHEFHACFYAWWYGKNSLFCPFFSQIYLISCNIFFSFFSYFSSIFFRKNEKIFFSEKKKKKIFLGMSSIWITVQSPRKLKTRSSSVRHNFVYRIGRSVGVATII